MKTDGKIFEERRDGTIDDAFRVSWATNADYQAVFQRVGESTSPVAAMSGTT